MTNFDMEAEKTAWQEIAVSNGVILAGVDLTDSDDMKELYKTFGVVGFAAKSRLRAFILERQQRHRSVYSMTFLVKGAFQSLGARGNVYKTLQATFGHYSDSDGIRVYYEGQNLRGKAYFISYEHASRFGNEMSDWEIHKELVHLQGVELESNTPTKEDDPGDLKRIMLQDYIPGDTESPIYSLHQLHTYRFSAPETTAVDATTPLAIYQCLDKQVIGYNPYKCHLKDKARFKSLQSNENNMVAASWQLHQQMDGLNATEGIPGVRITVHSSTGERSAEHDQRIPVCLNLEFRSQHLASLFQGVVMPRKVDETNWQVTVYVEDPGLFRECVTWKANDTQQKWDAYERFLLAI